MVIGSLHRIQDNILLIDKPKGISSFDVIRKLRKELGAKKALGTSRRVKMGHAGTLDPLASGLLIIGIGEGTKKLNEYLQLPKTYQVEVLLGIQTDTGDMEGSIIDERAISYDISKEKIETVLRGLIGILELPVPAYSAVKQGGEPLYKKARRGERVEMPIKPMEIHRATLYDISYKNDRCVLKLELDVGSGTYIRSVVEELGRRLGYPATVKELRRTRIGDFKIEDALHLD